MTALLTTLLFTVNYLEKRMSLAAVGMLYLFGLHLFMFGHTKVHMWISFY